MAIGEPVMALLDFRISGDTSEQESRRPRIRFGMSLSDKGETHRDREPT